MRTHLELLIKEIPFKWRVNFIVFHEIYFNEYVKAGILLEDIPYKNLAYHSRRKITNQAYNLWISENWHVNDGKIVSKPI